MSIPGIKKGGSAWQPITAVYGGPGQQTFQPGSGNLIASHPQSGGGRRRKRKTAGRRKCGGSTKISTLGGGKRRRRGTRRKKIKRGGACGCAAGGTNTGGETPGTRSIFSGGSAEPSSATTSLLSGSV